MTRRHLRLVLLCLVVTGCYGDRISALEGKVTALEAEHGKTREKLQALLIWVNKRQAPDVGLVNWIDAVHAKLFPGSGDPPKPSAPPPPF